VGPFALRKEVLRELRIVRHQLWSVIATFQIHALALTIAHTFASFPMFFILFFLFFRFSKTDILFATVTYFANESR
jgi:hypothetical protein